MAEEGSSDVGSGGTPPEAMESNKSQESEIQISNDERRKHVTETQNKVKLTDRMWARLLASTNQPSFLCYDEVMKEKVDKETVQMLDNMTNSSVQLP